MASTKENVFGFWTDHLPEYSYFSKSFPEQLRSDLTLRTLIIGTFGQLQKADARELPELSLLCKKRVLGFWRARLEDLARDILPEKINKPSWEQILGEGDADTRIVVRPMSFPGIIDILGARLGFSRRTSLSDQRVELLATVSQISLLNSHFTFKLASDSGPDFWDKYEFTFNDDGNAGIGLRQANYRLLPRHKGEYDGPDNTPIKDFKIIPQTTLTRR
ncbi:hypothetical protein HY389_02025 [Candidatus Daviesbacteria bacterium]|nr:hypothetical protein [Candidatus Daviesbacteria bacterium]